MSLPSNQQFPYNYIFEQSQHSNVNLQQLFPSTQPMLYQIPQEFQTNQNPQLNQPNIIEILQNLNYQNVTSSTNSLNQISELSKLLDAILIDDKQPKENKRMLLSFILQKIEEIKKEISNVQQYNQKQQLLIMEINQKQIKSQTDPHKIAQQNVNLNMNQGLGGIPNPNYIPSYPPYQNYPPMNPPHLNYPLQPILSMGISREMYRQQLYPHIMMYQNQQEQIPHQHPSQISSNNNQDVFNNDLQNDKNKQ